ncbi:MAG: hypothetical protein MUF48_01755 [Pirellulaceae bacterium]|nr:hypothetical protein [Pirellulaceae bacterium]
MKKLLSLLTTAALYFSLATVLAQAIALTALWARGALDRGRLYRVVAALHGLDVVTMHARVAARKSAVEEEQTPLEDRLADQELQSLDLDLRELAVRQGTLDMQNLETTVRDQWLTLQTTKSAFDTQLKDLAEEQQSTARRELQRTIEAMRPDQAKMQLLKMLEDQAMGDVVAIVTAMPVDKRKKIIAEFKAGTDADQLYEILKNIRQGEPVVSQVQDMRDALQQLSPTP